MAGLDQLENLLPAAEEKGEKANENAKSYTCDILNYFSHV